MLIDHIIRDTEESEVSSFGRQTMSTDEANADLEAEVSNWEGITVHKHATGGIEFRYNEKKLGHLRSSDVNVATADLELPANLLKELEKSGKVFPHEIDKSGITVPMGTVAEIAFAIQLFEYCYDLAVEKEESQNNTD